MSVNAEDILRRGKKHLTQIHDDDGCVRLILTHENADKLAQEIKAETGADISHQEIMGLFLS